VVQGHPGPAGATASEFKERDLSRRFALAGISPWIARAGHPETSLAELRYPQTDLAKFVEVGHPELAQVASTIAQLS